MERLLVNSSNTLSIPTGFGIITIDAIKENNDITYNKYFIQFSLPIIFLYTNPEK